jgi:hypothetical protein
MEDGRGARGGERRSHGSAHQSPCLVLTARSARLDRRRPLPCSLPSGASPPPFCPCPAPARPQSLCSHARDESSRGEGTIESDGQLSPLSVIKREAKEADVIPIHPSQSPADSPSSRPQQCLAFGWRADRRKAPFAFARARAPGRRVSREALPPSLAHRDERRLVPRAFVRRRRCCPQQRDEPTDEIPLSLIAKPPCALFRSLRPC